MLIDCDSCTARPRACGDCIVTHLLQVGPVRGSTEHSWSGSWDDAGPEDVPWEPDLADGTPDPARAPQPGRAPELTESEVAAVAVLSAGGLVPPLRLVTPARPAGTPPAGTPPAGTPPAGTSPAGTPPVTGGAGRPQRRGGRSRTG